jgi:hypothetical protein
MATKEREKQSPMSDWMKVMLEEIDRKQSEQEEGREELLRREREGHESADGSAHGGSSRDDTAPRR